MSNHNEESALTPEQQMEQQLCAYLLGELEGPEQEHVESRLAESEVWREAHARLRGTIELVRASLDSAGANASLSEGSLATLAAAAKAGAGHRPGGTSTQVSAIRYFMPIAAGLAVTLGGIWAWKNMGGETGPLSGSAYETSAKAPKAMSLGDGDTGGTWTRDAALQDESAPAGEPGATVMDLEEEEPMEEEPMGEVAFGAATLDQKIEAGAPSEKPQSDPTAARMQLVDRSSQPSDSLVPLGAGEGVKKDLSAQVSAEVGLVINSVGAAGAEGTVSLPRATTATSHGGAYHGPSDTVPPGGGGGTGGGPSTPGPAGLAGPGPNAPGYPTRAGGADLPVLNTPELVSEREAMRQKLGQEPTKAPAESAPVPQTAQRKSGAGKELAKSQDGPGANLGRRFEDKAKDELADGYYEDDGSGSFQPGARSRFAADDDAESPELLERRLRESIEARAKARYETIVVSCRPLPQETPRAMYFRFWGDNPFVYTSNDKLATFAADVDTASYTLARKYLVDGLLPTKEQVRTEEFVNYFHGDIAPPSEGVFAVRNEAVISPFGGSANRYMLRVGIRGKVVPKEDRPPMALVYVVDTSGSMRQGNRMDLVKHSLRLLGTELDGRDQVGIVTFSDTAKLLLPMTSMDQRATLESAIQGLTPDGSTNVEDGMRLGYELLSRVPAEGRLRRVVLISDGVANTGQTSADAISEEVRVHRQNGIYLSTIGVGMGNHNDALLERLADRGDGICDYVDDEEAARRAMVDRFSGGFIPIARDLKIQVEFDSKYVLRYRQLGYENRAVADRDFRNDAVDGGEVGSGHQVTALFELDCVPGLGEGDDALAHLGTVRLRYKSVETGENETVSETDHSIDGIRWGSQMDAATPGMQRSLVAAQFAEVLRRSNHAQGDDYAELYRHAARLADLPDFATDKDTLELRDMIRRAGELGAGRPAELSELDRTVNEYRRHVYLSETERQLRGQQTADQLEAIRQANAELERRIQELCLQEARAGR